MSIDLTVNDLDKWVQIKIKGKLGSNNTDEVRKLIRTIPSDNNYSYIVDLSQTELIDSSGLSVLLILRNHAGGDESNVILKNCRESLISILKMFKYDKLFSIVK